LAVEKYVGRLILAIYKNRSQISECGNWETEHYNSVLEIRRPSSFIAGNNKSEPEFFIGFSPVLHYSAVCLFENNFHH
jgi:hypothetical protein